MKYSPFYDVARKGRIYKRTVNALLAAAAALITVFYLIVAGIVVRHEREEIAVSSLDLLELSASSVNVSLDVMGHAMTQTLWNKDFTTYLVTLQQDQELNLRISRILQRGVEGNNLILRAYFYSPRADLVFQSGAALLSRQSQTVDAALTAYENGQLLSSMSTERDQTRLCSLGGQLYLYRELNVASSLGSLVYQLNRSALEEQLLSIGGQRDNIRVYDIRGEQLLGKPEPEAAGPDFQNPELFLTADNASARAARMTRGWYLYEDADGWRYVLPMDHDALTLSARDILLSYVPAFLLLLALFVLVAWTSARLWYSPINRLVAQVAPEGAPAPGDPDSDEAEILSRSYSSARAEQDQLRGIIQSISPDILSSMLKNLLNGKHLTEQRVEEILRGIGDPLPLRGSFDVIVCQLAAPEEGSVADADFNLYLASLRKLCEELRPVRCRIEVLHTDVLTIALLCAAREGEDILADGKTLLQTVRRNAQGLPFRVFCAEGLPCGELLNVRYAYKEARERAQYQRYLFTTGSSGEGTEAEESPEGADDPPDPDSMQARVRDMMDCAAGGDLERAERLLDRLLREIERQTAGDREAVHSALRALHDALQERVIVYPLSPEDRSSAMNGIPPREKIRSLGPEELVAASRRHAGELFRLAAAYGQKSRYKYIDQAKQYIAENYMDSSLSLNSVGDYVGISSSYLSELWSEVTHEKFSAYLSAFRVEKAQQLLSTTALTIKEIGYRCGFNSAQSFIRVFKKYTGLAPGQFRERQSS